MTIKGGSGAGGLTPNGKTILNFHFDYLHPSLRCPRGCFVEQEYCIYQKKDCTKIFQMFCHCGFWSTRILLYFPLSVRSPLVTGYNFS